MKEVFSILTADKCLCLFACAAAGQPGGVHQSVHHEMVLPMLPGQSEWSHSKHPPARDTVCHVYGLALSPLKLPKTLHHTGFMFSGQKQEMNFTQSVLNDEVKLTNVTNVVFYFLLLPNLAWPKRSKSINVAFTVAETRLQSDWMKKTSG